MATTYYWVGGSTGAVKTWQTGNGGGGPGLYGTNWSGGTIPLANDDIIINLSVAGTITDVPTITLNSISIGGTQDVLFASVAGATITINNTIAPGPHLILMLEELQPLVVVQPLPE